MLKLTNENMERERIILLFRSVQQIVSKQRAHSPLSHAIPRAMPRSLPKQQDCRYRQHLFTWSSCDIYFAASNVLPPIADHARADALATVESLLSFALLFSARKPPLAEKKTAVDRDSNRSFHCIPRRSLCCFSKGICRPRRVELTVQLERCCKKITCIHSFCCPTARKEITIFSKKISERSEHTEQIT